MSESETLPSTSIEAQLAEAIADALGEELPADWQEPFAVQTRRDHLAAVADLAGAAAIELLVTLQNEGHELALSRFGAEMMALERAMGDYTFQTQRDDAFTIVQAALEASAGEALAARLMRIIDRVTRL